jgi:hypothetical protein
MEFDLIGDIHGEAAVLRKLLGQLGYSQQHNGWRAPTGRQAVFLGDLIDRGPEQMAVVDIVRGMVDSGQARCVMGNHELNAIGWVTEDPDKPGSFLRAHTDNKRKQHEAFLAQAGEGSGRHAELIAWFKTLPVALDLGGVRAVHAWWNDEHIRHVNQTRAERPLDGDLLIAAFRKHEPTWAAFDGLTKGYELDLPPGYYFLDKDGHKRYEVRTQWWNEHARTFREVAVIEEEQRELIPEAALPDHFAPNPVEGSPVFVGHYWLKGKVGRLTAKLACLDYSVARDGPLVAYRWCGEQELDNRNFVAAR